MNSAPPPPRAAGRRVVIGGAIAAALLLTALFTAFSLYGRNRFEQGSRMTEAHSHVALLARGLADCARARPALPPSSRRVPADEATLRGGYASVDGDWEDEAFRCARFAPRDAQHFQYRWERGGDLDGVVHAVGDLDGDGHGETGFRVTVACDRAPSGLRCTVGQVDPVALRR